ncbi:hypothetical protein HID58_000682 [Brassica napus]|uniref:Uncharacterized protein n=1 Tax=Brassica napus TaxID=3708 RepID=A0ABQ7XKN0_BRANA|nr:hypothetical protein HID58_084769 [Brassica napus]KAH0878682.1 hypothetical protein HID58_066076 [Brassica napus]KAH0914249.1 hypothetical protein HID58_028695 [Brassica napus]KAH0933521.1 hypothetical protein HID58_010638 [Brassica napus]KAH0941045.1 hypothetical protein HID58_000682 [Brassica napus]
MAMQSTGILSSAAVEATSPLNHHHPGSYQVTAITVFNPPRISGKKINSRDGEIVKKVGQSISSEDVGFLKKICFCVRHNEC